MLSLDEKKRERKKRKKRRNNVDLVVKYEKNIIYYTLKMKGCV